MRSPRGSCDTVDVIRPAGLWAFRGVCPQNLPCDDEFYTKMLIACANAVSKIKDKIKDRRLREELRETCDKWARKYYEAVSGFGSPSYKNRQNLNCECGCP